MDDGWAGFTVGAAIMMILATTISWMCAVYVFGDRIAQRRLSVATEVLSAVSPCDGGYAVRHFDAGTFACIDTTWVEVKP